MAFGIAQETGVSKFPASADPSAPVTNAQLAAGLGGYVPMESLFQPITENWPAVDATNGPLKVNAAITNVQPSTTGMTFIPWNKLNAFNKQSQNWQAVPTANGVAANYCCQNTTTIRSGTSPGYVSTGLDFPAPIDTGWIVDSANIIVEYWMTTTHAGNQGVATPNHEVILCREQGGKMKRVTQMPKAWSNAQGGGNTKFWAAYQWSQALRDEFRLILSAGCWFAGIWVDTGAMIEQAPNKPICFITDTDSWAEPCGNVWSSFGGNGSVAGVVYPTSASLLMSNTSVQLALETGMAVIIAGQGGTGPFNAGPSGGNSSDAVRQNADSVGVVGFTPFMSQSRVNNWSTKFGPESGNNRYTVWCTFGGGNDRGGGFTKAAFKTQYQNGINRIIAKQNDIPIVLRGIQSLNLGALEITWNDAIREIAAATPNILGFIDDSTDYGGLGFNIKTGHLGPDNLHPLTGLGQFVGARDRLRMRGFVLPRSYVNKTRSVIVP